MKRRRSFYFLSLVVILMSYTSLVFSANFQYGQCLLDRSDSYNSDLKSYRNVALAKAAINKLKLQRAPVSLKWNLATSRLIYNLISLQTFLLSLNQLYHYIQQKGPDSLTPVSNYLSDLTGHQALSQMDGPKNPQEQNSIEDFLELLKELVQADGEAQKWIESIQKLMARSEVRLALGELYDQIQEASVGATPLDPHSIETWIDAGQFFQGMLFKHPCEECGNAQMTYTSLLHKWLKFEESPEPENFDALTEKLPPLLFISYPQLKTSSAEAQRVIEYYYTRTIEDFLFGRNGFNEADVTYWLSQDSNSKIIQNQALKERMLDVTLPLSLGIYKYLTTQQRVLDNAFDHFIWRGQEGNPEEKAIDGIARTLYGEAESCQISGAHQFEAIASVIAARAISMDQQNKENNLFVNVIDFTLKTLDKISPFDIAPLNKYKRGESDFGRQGEAASNPIIREMPAPVQVVSRPNQFSVWKLGDSQEFEVSRWIRWPKGYGYPSDLKVIVAGPVRSGMDPAQRKVLCPNHPVFEQAVAVATDLMTDYYGFANKFRFYQGQKRVVPYFYTHGPKMNLNFVRRFVPDPKLLRVQNLEGKNNQGYQVLPILVGDINCRTFKLYSPNHLEVWRKKTSNKKNFKKKSSWK